MPLIICNLTMRTSITLRDLMKDSILVSLTGFFDQVHVAEKWFFVCKKSLKIYLTEGKIPPS